MANEHIAAETSVTLNGKVYILTMPTVKDIQSVVLYLQKLTISREMDCVKDLSPEIQLEAYKQAKIKANEITIDNVTSVGLMYQLDMIAFIFYLLARKNHKEVTPDMAFDLAKGAAAMETLSTAMGDALALANGSNPTDATETKS